MKRTVAYVRVSTHDQSVDTQLDAIRRHCSAQGISISEIYSDEGVSGAQDSRPSLDRLKADCSKCKVGAVVVYKFDRLARSVAHLLSCLELFRRHGVDFISVSEGIDTSTPVGKMVFTFLGAIAEFERSLIQERVVAGVRRAKAEGVHCGRPRKGLDVGLAMKMREDGRSVREIAKAINTSSATVHRYLKAVSKTPL